MKPAFPLSQKSYLNVSLQLIHYLNNLRLRKTRLRAEVSDLFQEVDVGSGSNFRAAKRKILVDSDDEIQDQMWVYQANVGWLVSNTSQRQKFDS